MIEGELKQGEKCMKIKGKVPEYITARKVYEWNEETTLREQVFPEEFEEIVEKYCNWLLFYSWCYAKTQGFTNKCMKNWDVSNFGGKFKTLHDGIVDALSEFLKYESTEMLAEQKEVEKIYAEIDSFCKGVVYNEPNPLPPIEEPKPIPPKPHVEQKPNEPSKPSLPSKIPWGKILIAIVTVAVSVGSAIMPAWLAAILKLILSAFGG
jgi:hypothetical protein